MKIYHSLEEISLKPQPIALTIGNFDGVHLGHIAVLKRLKKIAPHRAVFTFSNHPCEVLHQTPISRLSTLSHRLMLLEKNEVDTVVVIPFTKTFAEQSAQDFLSTLKQKIPFSHLILGYDALIGHDRERNLSPLSKELNFHLEYLKPISLNNTIVSSSFIRSCIQAGQLKKASAFLGRPYSILATVELGEKKGRALGFHTANLPINDLALPPFGVYAVQVKLEDKIYPAVANLGFAPTLHENRPPLLEVHLIDYQHTLYRKQLEVFFIQFLRKEKRFNSPKELQAQIQDDISLALKLKQNI